MSDINLETRFTIPPQVMSRLVEDETVLLDLSTGLYFGLEGVGQRIWESISDGKTIGEVVDVVTAEFDVDEAQARADIIAFTDDLIDRGLLAR